MVDIDTDETMLNKVPGIEYDIAPHIKIKMNKIKIQRELIDQDKINIEVT